MKDYLFVYRGDANNIPKRSPEEMQASLQRWMDWFAGIAAQNKLVDRGNRLFPVGQVLKSDGVVSDGPYTEIKESILGYSLVKAGSLDEATGLSRGCPILRIGGSVEVREVMTM